MKSNTISCTFHGDGRAAYVCAHILLSLQDRSPRGFWWSRNEDACINAWCTDCKHMVDKHGGTWTPEIEMHADGLNRVRIRS